MAVNWTMWEAIGTVGATIVALFFGLFTLIREFRNRPKIVLQHEESDILRNPNNNVDTYYIRVTNRGSTTAKKCTIRVLEASQEDSHFVSPLERYHIFFEDAIQNGDYISTNFIHNHKSEEWFSTPGGKDKKFPREKTKFILLISGDNFPSYEKKITVEPREGTKDLKIIL